MKNIAIFRIAFQPRPNAELSNFLMTEITSNPQKNIAIPNPFGVLSIMTTEKTVDQVKEALLLNFPNLKFEVFEVTPEGQRTSSNPHANSTMDELLNLITEVGGFDNLPQTAKDRLHQLSGGGQ
jgi:hypothetical protein